MPERHDVTPTRHSRASPTEQVSLEWKKVARAERSSAQLCFLVLFCFLPVLLGFDCADPNEMVQTRFEHENETVQRDNLKVFGFFYDEQDLLSGLSFLEVRHRGSLNVLQTELFMEYEGHDFYSFQQPRTDRGLELMPAPDANLHRLGVGSFLAPTVWVHAAYVYLDPNVILLPVYTWRLYSASGSGPPQSQLDLTAMQYAFDRGSNTRLPEALYRPAAGQRVDGIWNQCDIQFRLAGHFDVEVPQCYTTDTEPSSDGFSQRCLECPATNPGCNPSEELCGCNNIGRPECTVAQYTKQQGHFIPDAINIYFVEYFSLEYEGISPTLGLACETIPWIFINFWRIWEDKAQTLLAHEIGHVLLDDSTHEPGTLMQAGNHAIVTLTEDQCQRARTTQLEVLSTALGQP